MTPQGIFATVGLGITLVVNTSALFYWGGAVKQMLRDHDVRIKRLERWRDTGFPARRIGDSGL